MKDLRLPQTIKVKIKKLAKGKFFAELVEYGVFTEAENQEELFSLINDLIYTYFDVSKELQKEFHYRPREDKDFEKAKPFIIFSTPNFFKRYLSS
ncbi:hypothetical protein HY357_04180 [Candidatus Roizmanbacteria bacterium]|nr:hypothetical protein [Candidatus Roizmanbacteria bacterium]